MLGQSKRALVSGGTGFLGSHVSRFLLSIGFSVTIIIRKSSSLSRLEDVSDQLSYILIDDLNSIEPSYDYFFHLATCYGRNGETNSEMEAINISFPMMVIEKLSENCVIYNFGTSLSSDVNFYAKSKNKFYSKLTSEYSSRTIVNLKLEHFFGPKDGSFIEFLVRSFQEKVNSIRLTKGEQIRDFIYYKDVISALHYILKSDNSGDYSIGSGREILLKDVVVKIKEIVGNSVTQLRWGDVPYRENEVMYSVANTKRLTDIGWAAEFSLEEGIRDLLKEK